jgi:hypothetical protein
MSWAVFSYVPYVFTGLLALRTWLPFDRETNTKMTSLMTSCTLAIWSQVGSIVLAQRALLGYILSDSVLKVSMDGFIGTDVAIHHALTLILVYSTQNRPESYHLIQKLMLMEFTTPFLYCSIILRNLKIQKTIMYACFAIALALWPYCRLYVPLTTAIEAYDYDKFGASATLGLFCLQVYWYFLLWTNAYKLIKKNR